MKEDWCGRLSPRRSDFSLKNPCEREFNLPDASGDKTCSLPVKFQTRRLADMAQMPEDKMAAYLETRGPFLARVIAADLEYAAPGGINEPASHNTHKENIHSPDQQLPVDTTDTAPTVETDDDLKSLLFSMVTEITGFTRDSLDLDMRLLDDLNLDSIKAGELIAKALIATGLEGQLEPLDFANATLTQIHQKLVETQNQHRTGDSQAGGYRPVRNSNETGRISYRPFQGIFGC